MVEALLKEGGSLRDVPLGTFWVLMNFLKFLYSFPLSVLCQLCGATSLHDKREAAEGKIEKHCTICESAMLLRNSAGFHVSKIVYSPSGPEARVVFGKIPFCTRNFKH